MTETDPATGQNSKGVPEIPIRQPYDSDETYATKVELHRLDVKEAACIHTLHTSKSATAIERSENALVKLKARRAELTRPLVKVEAPADVESISIQPDPECKSAYAPGSLEYRQELKSWDAKKKFLAMLQLRAEMTPEERAADHAERERVERERLARVRKESDPCNFNPHPWKPRGLGDEQSEAKRSPAQKRAQDENWSNQHTSAEEQRQEQAVVEPVRSRRLAYMLPDGTTIWPWLEKIKSPLQKETTLVNIPAPPGYVLDSSVIPDGFVIDEHASVWRAVAPDSASANVVEESGLDFAELDPLGLLKK